MNMIPKVSPLQRNSETGTMQTEGSKQLQLLSQGESSAGTSELVSTKTTAPQVESSLQTPRNVVSELPSSVISVASTTTDENTSIENERSLSEFPLKASHTEHVASLESTDNSEDKRLSAVMELSTEWISDEEDTLQRVEESGGTKARRRSGARKFRRPDQAARGIAKNKPLGDDQEVTERTDDETESPMSPEFGKQGLNLLNGPSPGSNSTLTPSNSSRKTVGKDVIRTSRPPLSSGSSNSGSRISGGSGGHGKPKLRNQMSWDSVNGSCASVLSSDASLVSFGLPSGNTVEGSSFSAGSHPSRRSFTRRGPEMISMTSLNSMPSLMSMQSMMSMPSLASLGALDSFYSLHESGNTMSSGETLEATPAPSVPFVRDLQIVSDNVAGTHINELAPAARTLLTTQQIHKEKLRWSNSESDGSFSSGMTHGSSGIISLDRPPMLARRVSNDSTPQMVRRRESFEPMSFDLQALDLSDHRPRGSRMPARRTEPLLSEDALDVAPLAARRHTSSSDSSSFMGSSSEFPEESVGSGASPTPSQPDKAPRKVIRRTSTQELTPLPTLMEDADIPEMSYISDTPPMPAKRRNSDSERKVMRTY